MAADRTTILQQAQLFASKGNLDAAIGEWNKLAKESPNDGTIHNSIGDLQLKRNAKTEAINAFLLAAKSFRDEGAPLKAIAAYKKVLKIDAGRYDIYRFLGDLNAERGLLSSAVSDYLTLAKFYLKENKSKEALEIYRLIIAQDPSNLDAHQRVAELCLQENLPDEAIRVYLQIGRERSAQGRANDARDAYAAVLKLDPANREAEQFINAEKHVTGGDAPRPAAVPGSAASSGQPTDMLGEARRRMASGQFEGAEAMLSQLLSREPGNPDICRLLAQLHLKQGQVNVASNEYRFLAGSALRSQDFALAESLLDEFLAVEPHSVPILELLGDLYEEKGDGAMAATHLGKAIAILLERPDPHMPSLPAELYERVKALDPHGPVRAQHAALFDPAAAAPAVQSQPTADVVMAEPPSPVHSEAVEAQAAAPIAAPDAPSSLNASAADTEISAAPTSPQVPDVAETPSPVMEANSEVPAAAPTQSQTKSPTVIPTAGPLSFAKASNADPAPVPPSPTAPPVAAATPAASAPTAEVAAPAAAAAPEPVIAPITIPVPAIEPEPATRYALGIAFRQMGIPEEAIEELKLSAQAPEFLLDSCIALALCLKDLRRYDPAIAQLQEASRHPNCVGDKARHLQYELGLLYKLSDRPDQAFRIFEAIADYHDVREILADLRASQSTPVQ